MSVHLRFTLLLLLFLAGSAQLRAQFVSTADSLRVDSLVRVARQLLDDDAPAVIALPDSLTKRTDTATGVRQSALRFAGVIRDKASGEGIPFATIFIAGTGTGTAANLDGQFELIATAAPGDSLSASAVGYATQSIRISRIATPGEVVVELSRQAATLSEFVFHAGEDPALVLVKNIIRHKPQNNHDRIASYRYTAYNKLEVDVQNLAREDFEKLPIPMIRQFSFIYQNVDSTSDEKPFLPLYLTETLSEYFYRHQPKKAREIITATQVKGFQNASADRYLGTFSQNINAYDNFLNILEKRFVSPIADNGPFYYKYKIRDTQEAYGHRIILVEFIPRRPGELVFYGDFWVVDSVFALQRISMEVPATANLNFARRISLYQEFAPVGDSVWFPVKDKFTSDFESGLGKNLPTMIGRKSTTYTNIALNDRLTDSVLNDRRLREAITVLPDARNRGEDYWDAARPEALNRNERAIYQMIDTLEELPAFHNFKRLMKTIFTGTVEAGPVEFGPLYSIYSSNPIEGSRLQLSLGTTPRLFKDLYISGHVAYGFGDERWKYSASALYLLSRKPRTYLYARHTYDISRNAVNSEGEVQPSNLFSTIGRKPGIPWKLALQDVSRLEFYHEYPSGFSHMLYGQRRQFWAYAPLPAAGIFDAAGDPNANSVIGSEIGVRLRFAPRENFLEGNYLRFSLGSRYPITELRVALGLKGLLGGQYPYQRATLTVSDEVPVPPLGKIKFAVFGGKIWGTLPYPLLEIHPGNEFYYYNAQAFNTMNNYSYISDTWAGLILEHNIGGGVFNYIPLLKKAKWRQFWTLKAITGGLSTPNKNLNLNKGYPFQTLDGKPYVELGTGVSNILTFLRVDFVWRVSPGAQPAEPLSRRFGVFGSIDLHF